MQVSSWVTAFLPGGTVTFVRTWSAAAHTDTGVSCLSIRDTARSVSGEVAKGSAWPLCQLVPRPSAAPGTVAQAPLWPQRPPLDSSCPSL